jgi:hypothetical protein
MIADDHVDAGRAQRPDRPCALVPQSQVSTHARAASMAARTPAFVRS